MEAKMALKVELARAIEEIREKEADVTEAVRETIFDHRSAQ